MIVRTRGALSEETRIIAVVCLLLMGLSSGIIGFSITRTRDAAIADAHSDARAAAVIFAERVRGTISALDTLLKLTAYERANMATPRSLRQLVADAGFASEDLLQLSRTDKTGMLVESNIDVVAPVSLADRDHIRYQVERSARSLPSELYIGQPVLGRVSKQWSIQLSRPIVKPDMSFEGVLVASLDPHYFERFFRQLQLAPEDEVVLVGLDGVVRMASRDIDAALAAHATRPDLVRRAATERSGWFLQEEAQGLTRISYLMRLPDYPLIVTVGISRAAVLKRLAWQTRIMLMVGGLVCLIIAGLGTVLTIVTHRLKQKQIESEQMAQDLEMEVAKRTQALADANALLRTIAVTDALTNLPNRRAFDRRLKAEVARASRHGALFSLLLIDIDHFKTINDELGHAAGDLVLSELGQLLKAEIRENDMATRVGGEEFAVILGDTGQADAVSAAERLRQCIAARNFNGRSISVTIGVAGFMPGDRASQIFERADRALYQGKNQGRDRVVQASAANEIPMFPAEGSE
jgi:diguanylate cyclase (GGDEF)-like protein